MSLTICYSPPHVSVITGTIIRFNNDLKSNNDNKIYPVQSFLLASNSTFMTDSQNSDKIQV